MKEHIRPMYSELQGYLKQAPDEKTDLWGEAAQDVGRQVSNTIDELNSVTGENYDQFKSLAKPYLRNGDYIPNLTMAVYRQRLAGLIARLHGKYFPDEPAPFSGMPNTIINQTQNQSIQIELILDFQEMINEKIQSTQPESKERKYLEKIKNSLSTVKSFTDAINLSVSTAKTFGLGTDDLLRLFS